MVIALVQEEWRRKATGDSRDLPFGPDHGQQLLNDPERHAQPGYPAGSAGWQNSAR
jgi:mannonate dehydratase